MPLSIHYITFEEELKSFAYDTKPFMTSRELAYTLYIVQTNQMVAVQTHCQYRSFSL